MRYFLFFLLINSTLMLAQVPPPILPQSNPDIIIPPPDDRELFKPKPYLNKKNIRVLDSLYSTWKKNVITNGEYLHPDSCNMDYAERNRLNTLEFHGIPNEAKRSYADINQDDRLDALYTFNPQQCDGGNGSIFMQTAVLIVSFGNTHLIKVYDPSMSLGMGGGFHHFLSISKNGIYGKYFEHLKEDGRCCPSIEKTVFFEYKDGHLYLDGEKWD